MHDPHDPYGDGHFDERAATWDEHPGHVARADAIVRALADTVPLTRSTRLFEYGAGTGLVTAALRDRVGPITLADTSAGMRAVIRAKIEAGTLAGARVWDLDLSTTPPPTGERFDLIITVMTLHHLMDLAPALTAFAELLTPTGHLCIADLEAEDGSFHGDDFHGHPGFTRPELAAQLDAAGFIEPTFSVPHHVERGDRSYPMFLAVTTRHRTESPRTW